MEAVWYLLIDCLGLVRLVGDAPYLRRDELHDVRGDVRDPDVSMRRPPPPPRDRQRIFTPAPAPQLVPVEEEPPDEGGLGGQAGDGEQDEGHGGTLGDGADMVQAVPRLVARHGRQRQGVVRGCLIVCMVWYGRGVVSRDAAVFRESNRARPEGSLGVLRVAGAITY